MSASSDWCYCHKLPPSPSAVPAQSRAARAAAAILEAGSDTPPAMCRTRRALEMHGVFMIDMNLGNVSFAD
jgi:hypothetical protein